MNIYERFGRSQDALLTTAESYRETLALLRSLKSGAVDIKNVTVTLDGWSVSPEVKE